MDTADVMASKAYIDDAAARLRAGGVPGPLGALRVLVLADLTQGRDPLGRLGPHVPSSAPASANPPADPGTWSGWGAGHDDTEDVDSDEPSAPARDAPVPMPALVNLTVSGGTLSI